ncbi:MAG: SOS response-associated peptidase [Acidimicrobiales bacterium]
MCGRYVSASSAEEIAAFFGVDAIGDPLEENYNVAPTEDVYVVYEDGSQRRIDAFRWGLVPGFAKDLSIGNRMINARAETVATNNAFKRSFAGRRCIVPADGFYEWHAVPGRTNAKGKPVKQPYYIHRADDAPLAFAGLWAEWKGDVAGQRTVVRSTTIITTTASDEMGRIHDRMPVILPAPTWDLWLDPEVHAVERIAPLLVPAGAGALTMHPVSTEVNNVRNDGRQLIEEIDPNEPTDGQTTLL